MKLLEKSSPDLTTPSEYIITIQNVSKKFTRSLKRSMLYAFYDMMKVLSPFKKPFDDTAPLVIRKGEFLVLDNISFKLKRGDSLALLGINGSGKTTLLRLIYGIFAFERGRIEVNGRIGAMLAAGVGFHNQMTGRENIYVSGTILGLSRSEIDRYFDEIVAFADIAEFIDAPAGTYSSGMRVRLGFAIIVHAEVDLIIADEILAVGDAAFREKCFNKLDELKAKGASILFVSHDISQIERVCEYSAFFAQGKLLHYGPTSEIVPIYRSKNNI